MSASPEVLSDEHLSKRQLNRNLGFPKGENTECWPAAIQRGLAQAGVSQIANQKEQSELGVLPNDPLRTWVGPTVVLAGPWNADVDRTWRGGWKSRDWN